MVNNSKKQKVELIKTLYHRACMICSPEFLHSNTEKTKEILVKSGYPLEFIKMIHIKSHDENRKKLSLYF